MRMLVRLLAVFAVAAVALALPAAASAHPLGNFTINHYTGIRVSPSSVELDHVLDMAEIPTFQERQTIDTNGDGTISTTEAGAYRQRACATTGGQLSLTIATVPQVLQVTATGLTFLPGAGGLQTLRLVCEYVATLSAPMASATTLTFADASYPERIGWHELIAAGDGMTLAGQGLESTSVSDRLTHYPQDLLAQPLDQVGLSLSVAPGGPRLLPLLVPDAQSASSPQVAGASAGGGPDSTPGGIGAVGDQLFSLLRTEELDVPLLLLAVLIAAGLGALHAIQPGHGKTIMAAYLIGSRGTVGQAFLLGATVTAAHTLNVLLLGAVVLSATSFLPSDRVIPVLGVISALTVVGLGAWMLLGQIREARQNRLNGVHEHDLEDRDHPLDPAPGDEGGWHSHGGQRHSHLPPTTSQPLRRRTLVALGLAGGLVPAPEALFILLISIAVGRVAFGVALIVAFGSGMALVMTGIGLALVYAREWVNRLPSVGRAHQLAQILPSAAAVVVIAAGLWLTSQAVGQARF